jgi:hypothetical protein
MTIEEMNNTIEAVLGQAGEDTLYVTRENGKLLLNDYNHGSEISENITEEELIAECNGWAAVCAGMSLE